LNGGSGNPRIEKHAYHQVYMQVVRWVSASFEKSGRQGRDKSVELVFQRGVLADTWAELQNSTVPKAAAHR
jgi:hypothetical protein